MLGQSISMVLPPVVGYKIVGKLNSLSTSTDLVLTITKVNGVKQLKKKTLNVELFFSSI